MNFKALDRGEMVAMIGGILLGVSLFLNWYSLRNRNATLGGCHGPDSSCTGWAALSAFRFLFLVAALAPVILAYIILRGHALSWPRGEMTAIVAIVALIMTLFLGVVDHPGTPPGEISVATGWFVALVGDLLILTGSVWRSQQGAGRRKPPGVL
jgi:uncharacterized membrane protein